MRTQSSGADSVTEQNAAEDEIKNPDFPFVTHQPPQLCPPARLQGVLDFALLPNILCKIYIELLVVHVPIIEYSVTAGISDYILNQSHAHQPAGMISSSRDEMVSDKRSR